MSEGRLPLWRAALVVARRDFTAVLMSRAFIFFLLGPLFPVLVMALAGGVGAKVESQAASADIGLAMSAPDIEAMIGARNELASRLGAVVPPMVPLRALEPEESFDAREVLESRQGSYAAIVTGTLAAPQLTATPGRADRWQGLIGMVAARAAQSDAPQYPSVETFTVETSGASQNTGRLRTAQGAQLLLFLLIMLLASMALSNMAEEKGNKIIEILAAAVPMDAVFLGKLFAMLAVSLVALSIWGSVVCVVLSAGGISLSDYANPGVGWPLFFLLFAVYFAMGYLLLGAIFLAVGSLAATVREVQTLSMPVTMFQILVFFLASLSVTAQGTMTEYAAIAFPLSSPFAMVARAANAETLWPHLLAIGWQAAYVALFIRIGAGLFRKRVMKSGPRRVKSRKRAGLFGNAFSKGSARSA